MVDVISAMKSTDEVMMMMSNFRFFLVCERGFSICIKIL